MRLYTILRKRARGWESYDDLMYDDIAIAAQEAKNLQTQWTHSHLIVVGIDVIKFIEFREKNQ